MGIITIILLLAFSIFFPISLFQSPISYTTESSLPIGQFEKTLESYFAMDGFYLVIFMMVFLTSMFLNATKNNKNVAKASFAVSLASFSYFIYVIIYVFTENIDFAENIANIDATWSVSAVFIVLIVMLSLLIIVNIINFVKQMIRRN
ncbi:MAG: hypothetical protein J1F32_02685 [Erysipelotrichales bacterium]|nr:hypothetical protein [Erysipelotrichales bacterium]